MEAYSSLEECNDIDVHNATCLQVKEQIACGEYMECNVGSLSMNHVHCASDVEFEDKEVCVQYVDFEHNAKYDGHVDKYAHAPAAHDCSYEVEMEMFVIHEECDDVHGDEIGVSIWADHVAYCEKYKDLESTLLPIDNIEELADDSKVSDCLDTTEILGSCVEQPRGENNVEFHVDECEVEYNWFLFHALDLHSVNTGIFPSHVKGIYVKENKVSNPIANEEFLVGNDPLTFGSMHISIDIAHKATSAHCCLPVVPVDVDLLEPALEVFGFELNDDVKNASEHVVEPEMSAFTHSLDVNVAYDPFLHDANVCSNVPRPRCKKMCLCFSDQYKDAPKYASFFFHIFKDDLHDTQQVVHEIF